VAGGARARPEAIRQLAELRRRLAAAEDALIDALAAMKQAEGASDAAEDRFAAAERALEAAARTARRPRVGCAAERCTRGEPSWEPSFADIRPYRARSSVRSIYLTSYRATVNDIERRRWPPSHREGHSPTRQAGTLGHMPPEPDRRWAHIVGGIDGEGRVQPMSFDVLDGLAAEWAELLPDAVGQDGPGALLRMARSLFAHAWLIGFQAMEAAFRVLYPNSERVPLRKLIRRAEREGILPSNIADVADTGAGLRNLFSHPATQAALTVGMAASMLENTHRLVALVVAAARQTAS
jgi:hypothetical protein